MLTSGCARIQPAPAPSASQYAIATQGIWSSRAAQEILNQGGNLFDAAIAASFVISVERPHSTGISGGGFWLSFNKKTKTLTALDFRERAPKAIRLSQSALKKDPKALTRQLQDTPRGGGTPGMVAGMAEAHRRWGSLPWKRLLEPAIRLATEGFPVYPDLADALADRRDILAQNPAAARIFLHADGRPLGVGDRLVQQDLATTLRRIANEGAKSFYQGALARQMSQWFRKNGSAIRAQDLRNYQVIERKPVVISAWGHRLAIMPLPSSGGVHLPQMLKLLEPEALQLKSWGPRDERMLHRLAQAMQLAYADRARYLGDPDFSPIPSDALISPAYLNERKEQSFGDRALKAEEILPLSDSALREIEKSLLESSDTTHLSFLDAEGNAIATTQSINGWMGSGQVIEGTGMIMNNTLDDFSLADNVPNSFGAIGGQANRLQPGKTPLSSMTPTLAFEASHPELPTLAIGAPGGTRIITCILQVLLNRWIHELPLDQAIAAPRIHQQWIPDRLTLESKGPWASDLPHWGFSNSTIEALRQRGHPAASGEVHCRVLAAERTREQLQAASDPRDIGLAIVK
jgi:gamma-glutamyltranspeptidase/glutathione hydrolase